MNLLRALFGLAIVAATSVFAVETRPSYLSQAEIETAIGRLTDLEYPMTQREIMSKLGVFGRNLPGMVIGQAALKNPGPMFYLIHLTDPDSTGRSYELYLWFDQNPRNLSGDAFVLARNIEYAEVLFREGDRATYVAQSSRYPVVRLSYAARKRRRD